MIAIRSPIKKKNAFLKPSQVSVFGCTIKLLCSIDCTIELLSLVRHLQTFYRILFIDVCLFIDVFSNAVTLPYPLF